MSKCAATLMLMAVVASSCAAEVLDVLPRFEVNQRFEFEIVRTRIDSAFKASNGKAFTNAVAVVKSKDENGFMLEWTPSAIRFENPEHAKAPLASGTAKALEGVPIQFQLTPKGQVQRFANMKEIQAEFEKRKPALIQTSVESIKNPAERKAFLDSAPKVFVLDALLHNPFQEVTLWMGLSGFTLNTAEPIKQRALAGHPVDEGRISCDVEMAVKELAVDRKELVVAGRQVYDRAGFVGHLRRLLLQSQISFRPDGKIPEVDMVDAFDFIVDTDKAWPKAASRKRTTIIAPLVEREETISIKLK